GCLDDQSRLSRAHAHVRRIEIKAHWLAGLAHEHASPEIRDLVGEAAGENRGRQIPLAVLQSRAESGTIVATRAVAARAIARQPAQDEQQGQSHIFHWYQPG